MVTFIEKKPPKTPKWKPRLFDREWGAEYLDKEVEELQNLELAMKTRQNVLIGYAYYLPRKDMLLLLGSRFSGQIMLPCIISPSFQGTLPPNYAHVELHGDWERQIEILSGNPTVTDRFVLESWRELPHPSPPKPPISVKELTSTLFFRHGYSLEEALAQNLLFGFISSPPLGELGQSGGIFASFRVSEAAAGRARSLLGYLRSLTPRELLQGGKSLRLPDKTRVRLTPDFSMSYKSFDKGVPLKEQASLRTRHFPITEVSSYLSRKNLQIGLGGNVEEFADLRHVIPVDSTIPRRHPPFREDVALPLIQFMIATHYHFPTYEPTILQQQGETYVQRLLDHLEIPAEELISEYKIVNPNFWGEPARIVRVALATARATGQTTLRKEAFDKSFEAIQESLDTLLAEVDLEKTGSVRGRSLPTIQGRILRIIRKYGDEIERAVLYEELGVISSDHQSNNAITELITTGRLYEPRTGRLKRV